MESSGSQALPAPLLGPTPGFAEMGKDQLREEARALGIQVRRRILNSKGMVNYTWRKSPDLAAGLEEEATGRTASVGKR